NRRNDASSGLNKKLEHRVIHLFLFIDWIMTLPNELKKSFSQQVFAYEEERKMRFISSIEELGIEKGMLANAREMVAEVISTRFSQIPENILKAISTIEDQNILKELLKKAVLTRSLEQFESEFQGYANC
ncbi:MAG: cytosolic protein, partial [Deltaproteobacteria bacterium]